MKKILIQLDSDRFPSTFDSIVAHDAGADVVQSYGAVTPAEVRSIIPGAFFTRGIPDLKNLAVWISGSDVEAGERLLAETCRTFFGPFKVSVMLDSNGCNTTASTAIAKLGAQVDLQGKSAFILGPGPVGLRAAVLLAGEGCRVSLGSIPPHLLGARYSRELAERTLEAGRKAAQAFQRGPAASTGGSVQVEDVADIPRLEKLLDTADILAAAGPAGLQVLPLASWSSRPQLRWLLDFNLTEPLGIEGIKPSDDFADYGGKRALGALAIGNPKMKVHKACIASLFERNDLVLDVEGVYRIAKQFV
jgi:methylenetetrahydrofolate/methylenetetrahydromethanopterin dehydrogenase (NADP+)